MTTRPDNYPLPPDQRKPLGSNWRSHLRQFNDHHLRQVIALVTRHALACAATGTDFDEETAMREAVEAVAFGHADSLLRDRIVDEGERRRYPQYVGEGGSRKFPDMHTATRAQQMRAYRAREKAKAMANAGGTTE